MLTPYGGLRPPWGFASVVLINAGVVALFLPVVFLPVVLATSGGVGHPRSAAR